MSLGHATYLVWLVACAGPILLGQWLVWHAILRRQARAIFVSAVVVGAYLSLADGFAIADGVWSFSTALTLGIRIGPVPLEEVLFFALTSLLVTQSMTLFTAAVGSGGPTPKRKRR